MIWERSTTLFSYIWEAVPLGEVVITIICFLQTRIWSGRAERLLHMSRYSVRSVCLWGRQESKVACLPMLVDKPSRTTSFSPRRKVFVSIEDEYEGGARLATTWANLFVYGQS